MSTIKFWSEIINKVENERNPDLPIKFSQMYNDDAIINYCKTMIKRIMDFDKGENDSFSANPCPNESQDLR